MTKRNEMMDRPVINKEVRDFLRKDQKQLSGHLKELQNIASERRNPVIPHEKVSYFIWLLDQLKTNKILEVGTDIGFSASIITEYTDDYITTINHNLEHIELVISTYID